MAIGDNLINEWLSAHAHRVVGIRNSAVRSRVHSDEVVIVELVLLGRRLCPVIREHLGVAALIQIVSHPMSISGELLFAGRGEFLLRPDS